MAHYEEEGYGGGGEEQVFPLGTQGSSSKAVSHGPSAAVLQDIKNATGSITVSLHRTSTNGSRIQSVLAQQPSPNHLPVNLEEAQLAKPDQRVVLLLLEDGSLRPCHLLQ